MNGSYIAINVQRILQHLNLDVALEKIDLCIQDNDNFLSYFVSDLLFALQNIRLLEKIRDYQEFICKILIEYLLSGAADDESTNSKVKEDLDILYDNMLNIGEQLFQLDFENLQAIYNNINKKKELLKDIFTLYNSDFFQQQHKHYVSRQDYEQNMALLLSEKNKQLFTHESEIVFINKVDDCLGIAKEHFTSLRDKLLSIAHEIQEYSLTLRMALTSLDNYYPNRNELQEKLDDIRQVQFREIQ